MTADSCTALARTTLLATTTLSDMCAYCRNVVERLSVPGVRRLIIVQPQNRHVEGIVSLSDIAAYIFDVS